jgi:Relaxase/Mobilisation nuclease domain
MIANLNKGGNAYGTIKYAAFKDGAYLLDTNMAGYDPAQLASEFEYFVKKNNYVQVPVFHASINFHPSDRKLTEEEYIDIASDLRKELQFDDNNHQYLLALHTDAKLLNTDEIRPHLHLIINRVDYQGKCKNDYLDYINIQKA